MHLMSTIVMRISTNCRRREAVLGEDGSYYSMNCETSKRLRDNSVGLTAMIVFIGIYLGVVFLISGAAILSLKELSEAADSKEKYGSCAGSEWTEENPSFPPGTVGRVLCHAAFTCNRAFRLRNADSNVYSDCIWTGRTAWFYPACGSRDIGNLWYLFYDHIYLQP